MSPRLLRFLFQYFMLIVLLALCMIFSVVTLSEQQPTGPTAAKQLAADLVRQFGKGARVLIAVRE